MCYAESGVEQQPDHHPRAIGYGSLGFGPAGKVAGLPSSRRSLLGSFSIFRGIARIACHGSSYNHHFRDSRAFVRFTAGTGGKLYDIALRILPERPP